MSDGKHPCDTCLRWPECNGVDWGSCPAYQAQEEQEKAPTEMAEFLTKKLHIRQEED